MLPGWVTRTLHQSTPTSNNYAGRCKVARGSWRMLGGQIKPLRFRIMQTTSGPRSFMQGSNPSSALFSAQRPRFETGMACSSLTKRTSWSNGPFTSVPCSTGPQKWPMKHWSPFSSAPWSQNLMPHLTQQRLMQLSNSCKQARLRDQMEYQPRCSKLVVKPLSLTLPGCSKCSGSMASSHRTSGMPTSSTCTKTRVIAHPATTTAGSASSALQARYSPVSCWTGSPSTYWMMLCLTASVASESRGARWIWSLLSGSSRKNVSSSTKTSTCSSSISPRHSTLWTELHSGRYSASLDAHLDLYRSSAPSMMACFAGS